jgi:hypothetical protein
MFLSSFNKPALLIPNQVQLLQREIEVNTRNLRTVRRHDERYIPEFKVTISAQC